MKFGRIQRPMSYRGQIVGSFREGAPWEPEKSPASKGKSSSKPSFLGIIFMEGIILLRMEFLGVMWISSCHSNGLFEMASSAFHHDARAQTGRCFWDAHGVGPRPTPLWPPKHMFPPGWSYFFGESVGDSNLCHYYWKGWKAGANSRICFFFLWGFIF